MKRYILVALLISFLLFGCVSKINNKAVRNLWEGQNISNYIKVAGEPKYKLTSPNGNTIYVFNSYGDDSTKELYVETDAMGKIIHWDRR